MKPSFFDRMRVTMRTAQTNDDHFWWGACDAVLFVFDETTDAVIDDLLSTEPNIPDALPFRRIFIEDERFDDFGIYIESDDDGCGKICVIGDRGDRGYVATDVCDFDLSAAGGVSIEIDGKKVRIEGVPLATKLADEIRKAGGDPTRNNAVPLAYHALARLDLIMMPSEIVERDEIDVRTINRKRRIMNRPPIAARTIVRIKPGAARLISDLIQDSRHEPCRPLHAVRGHLRHLKSGRVVPVRPHRRGDARFGVRIAEYHVTAGDQAGGSAEAHRA